MECKTISWIWKYEHPKVTQQPTTIINTFLNAQQIPTQLLANLNHVIVTISFYIVL
jgi:hypothetical protein